MNSYKTKKSHCDHWSQSTQITSALLTKCPMFGSVCSYFGPALPPCLCQRRWPVAVFYNILDLAGINARILFKKHQQQDGPVESQQQQRSAELRAEYMEGKAETTTAAAAETRRQRQCLCSKELQTEQNVGHLKCHKPVCEESGGRLICGL